MACELKTRPNDESVLEYVHSVEPARRRAQGLELLDIFCEETGAELHGLTLYGSNADLLAKLGKHRVGKRCLYVNTLEDVDLGVLRQLIRRGWADTDAFVETHPDALVEPVESPLPG